MRRTSVILDVGLPSASGSFQSVHSGVTCKLYNKPHNGHLATLFPEVTHKVFLQRELEYTVG